ncbi:MAG TPA: hypothetical protein VJ948_11375 [Acidimicrobiia bacterium]|nr:hypothetical protein [Acidimicrobiia bacterium]
MPLLIWLGAGAILVIGFAWLARRRWDNVDSYYEREHQDPPVFDVGGWFGGGRW